MVSVPFKSRSTFDMRFGLTEGRGAIAVEDTDVVVEAQVRPLPTFKQTVRTYRFGLTDLEEVRHRRTPFWDTLQIRTRPMEHAAEIPGAQGGVLTLRVGRRHRRAVDDLLERLDLWLT